VTSYTIPVGVQHGRSMTTEERNLFRKPALLIHRNNSECAATAGLPIDGNVFRVYLTRSAPQPMRTDTASSHLDQVCIPRIAANVEVVVCRLFPRWLPKHMSYSRCVSLRSCAQRSAASSGAYDISTHARIVLPFVLMCCLGL
jgi:hypothetical protein